MATNQYIASKVLSMEIHLVRKKLKSIPQVNEERPKLGSNCEGYFPEQDYMTPSTCDYTCHIRKHHVRVDQFGGTTRRCPRLWPSRVGQLRSRDSTTRWWQHHERVHEASAELCIWSETVYKNRQVYCRAKPPT